MVRFMVRSFILAVSILILPTTIACHASSAAVKLPNPTADEPLSKSNSSETVVLAGGCFWGIQAVFEHVEGGVSATSGDFRGAGQTWPYEVVGTGHTGHCRSGKVVYHSLQVSFVQIL